MTYKTKEELRDEHQTRQSIAVAVVAVVVFFGLFFVTPGMMVVTFAVRPFAMGMDRGQLWIFSVVVSAAIFVGLRLALGDNKRASTWYVVLCVLALGSWLIAQFGIHARWPDLMVDAFFKGRS